MSLPVSVSEEVEKTSNTLWILDLCAQVPQIFKAECTDLGLIL